MRGGKHGAPQPMDKPVEGIEGDVSAGRALAIIYHSGVQQSRWWRHTETRI